MAKAKEQVKTDAAELAKISRQSDRKNIRELGVQPSVSTLSLGGLQERVREAECNTKKLVERLAELGFSSEVRTNAELSQHELHKPVRPFQAATDTVQSVNAKLCEISDRLCANEVSLETLQKTIEKIQLQQAAILQQNDKSLGGKTVKVVGTSSEAKRLSKHLAKSQRELRQLKESQQDSHDAVRKLTSALDIATSNKMAIVTRMEEMKGAKQKAINRLSELKAKLAHETAKRIELEEMQSSLLTQVKEMDNVVDATRGEVRTLSQDCTVLRKEVIRAREELTKEQQRRLNAEKKTKQISDKLEANNVKVAKLSEEFQAQSAEFEDTKKQLVHVQGQYVHSHEDLRKSNAELQTAKNCISDLQQKLSQCQSAKDKLAASYKTVVESEQKKSHAVVQREEELETALTDTRKQNSDLLEKVAQLEDTKTEAVQLLHEARQQLVSERQDVTNSAADMEQTVALLRCQLDTVVAEKQHIMVDKEKLLEEINQAVDGMSNEREKLNSQIGDLQARLAQCNSEKVELQEAAQRLQVANSARESQTVSLRQHQKLTVELKEVELTKDKSQRQLQRMQTRVEKLESHKTELVALITEMEKRLSACQEDNASVVESLHMVTASNQQLQEMLENTRAELEKKAREVDELCGARETWNAGMQQLQDEVNQLQTQLVTLEGSVEQSDSSALLRLETAVTHYKSENTCLLESAAHARANMKACTTEKRNLEQSLEAMEELCKQRENERDQVQHEVLEMRKLMKSKDSQHDAQLKGLHKKNSDLIQQMANLNTEYKTLEALKQQLEDRLCASEQQMSKLKRDVMAMRGQLSNARKSQEKAEKQLRITKTAKQSNTKSMSDDPDKLRRDLNVLAEAQVNSKRLISNQQDELERSKAANVLIEQRCEELVAGKERELVEFRSAAEQLIADALERSSQATAQLQEAKQSYKLQLTRLESELSHERQSQTSMKVQSSLHKTELEQARLMAYNQTKKAQQAIQVCRLTVAKLANQAEVDQSSSTDNVARLTTQLQIERNLASSTAQKYEQLKVSSAKRCRELAEEVTHLKSLHTSRDQINQ